MNPRLTRGEYWLLNIVVTHWAPISWLAASTPGPSWNRMCDHGMNRKCLVETLLAMAERGWIEAERHTIGCAVDGEDVHQPLILSRDHIEQALDESPAYRTGNIRSNFGLAATGGAVWEAFASPLWERYLDAYSGCPAESNVADHADQRSICGASKSRIEALWRLFEREGEIIDRASIQWEVLTPWEATYWKTLPVGYRLTYQFQDSPEDYTDLAKRNALYERCHHLERWYDWD